jgi:hypothetical protein
MHTALRLGGRAAEEVRRINPRCHICFYGLYASLNADYLLSPPLTFSLLERFVLPCPGSCSRMDTF